MGGGWAQGLCGAGVRIGTASRAGRAGMMLTPCGQCEGVRVGGEGKATAVRSSAVCQHAVPPPAGSPWHAHTSGCERPRPSRRLRPPPAAKRMSATACCLPSRNNPLLHTHNTKASPHAPLTPSAPTAPARMSLIAMAHTASRLAAPKPACSGSAWPVARNAARPPAAPRDKAVRRRAVCVCVSTSGIMEGWGWACWGVQLGRQGRQRHPKPTCPSQRSQHSVLGFAERGAAA